MNAFGRTEILKDGAAALYGSDAIAGVVNFISRAGFEGFEITGSQQWIDGSDGNQMLGMTFGWVNDRTEVLLAFEWDHRDELTIGDRDWGLKPFAENFNGGWSTTGMPGTTYLRDPSLPVPDGALPGTNQQVYAGPEPLCEELGGDVEFGQCSFQFTGFDNLIEETDQYKTYGEVNFDFNDTTTLHLEGLYSVSDIPEWKSSPAYPPNSLYGPDRIVPANNPGLIQYKQDYPQLFANLPAGETIDSVEVYQRSRMLGVNGRDGQPLEAKFKTTAYRLAASLQGEFSGFSYDAGISYSQRQRETNGYDMQVQGMAFALNGYGGPDCTPGGGDPATSTQGQGPCQWFNPFSTAIEYSVPAGIDNPAFVPSLANSPELIDWLTLRGQGEFTNELLVFDFVVNGETNISLPGGNIGWAAGIQARNEKFDTKLNDVANSEVEPCPWTNPFAVDLGFTTADQLSPNCTTKFGLLAFGVPGPEFSTDRTVYGAFAEFALPITDTLDMQLAVRFEDYGQSGETLDPKLAVRWQAADWLALRGSVSSTFRGPPQSYLGGIDTYLNNIPAASAYRAVNTIGNPDLDPEKALATNLGVIFQTAGLFATLDYWYFDFKDAFQLENPNQIIGAYTANGCQGNGTPSNPFGPGVGTPVCDEDLRPRFVPEGTSVVGLASVDTYFINGADIKTSGLDFNVSYTFEDVGGGDLTLGTEGSYILEYKSDDFVSLNGTTLAPGGDFVGFMNIGRNPFYPLPDLKGNAYVRYARGGLRLSYTYRYVADYEDVAPPHANLQNVEDMGTHDFTAIYMWRDFTIAGTVNNFTDEDPPEVYLPQNYDPYTHNPFGRMFKLQLTYHFGGS
jgi:iron complex outermembrane receptor protein